MHTCRGRVRDISAQSGHTHTHAYRGRVQTAVHSQDTHSRIRAEVECKTAVHRKVMAGGCEYKDRVRSRHKSCMTQPQEVVIVRISSHDRVLHREGVRDRHSRVAHAACHRITCSCGPDRVIVCCTGRVWKTGKAEWHADVTNLPAYKYLRRELAIRANLKGCCAVPIQVCLSFRLK